ncbi:MAG: hypothetical protein QF890_02310 [Myxococcota bacterium]|jgi:hypothetical protein|nr:hypothetical protein [Deltaproteobacteria bacterium]MCP4239105.1 hypothetical protein [bacterium]MCP4741351.1 hypothetical protein [Actinomycetales bacterium]MDP6074615.1 hypothetical protein [Myxococcota bacterium]MDP7072951.1 hypothetical protein [Myxococcota bacterium]
MRKLAASMAFAALVALLVPGLAGAQGRGCELSGGYRQFKGRVDRVGPDKLSIDSGKGAKLEFAKGAAVEVMGEKTDWKRLRKQDRVLVSWSLADDPRTAHEVCVLPAGAPGS